jgi:hypothetical protein
MEKILVDIREENNDIQEYFKNKDLVSVDDLLNAIDDLIYDKHKLEEEIEEMNKSNEPDPHDLWLDKEMGIL